MKREKLLDRKPQYVMVNRFKDKSYVHLSDISKCFQQGVGFDMKKIKSITTETKGAHIFRYPSDNAGKLDIKSSEPYTAYTNWTEALLQTAIRFTRLETRFQ